MLKATVFPDEQPVEVMLVGLMEKVLLGGSPDSANVIVPVYTFCVKLKL
jgi:hypothetical protein